ncbi:MAG: response regulator [Negativicutes bacterium]|nr:response regulator [Negativicutes bacterium]
MHVLSVDDSAIVRKIIRGALEVLQFDCLEADSGEQALAILAGRDDIGLVLLDWNMPGMSGLEVLRAMRADPRWAGIPVMMVTTEGERHNIVRAIEEGANNYLVKPFVVEELLQKISDTIGLGDGEWSD